MPAARGVDRDVWLRRCAFYAGTAARAKRRVGAQLRGADRAIRHGHSDSLGWRRMDAWQLNALSSVILGVRAGGTH